MLSLLVGAAIVRTSRPVAEIPFETIGNHIWIEATLNGRPVQAVFDTGASVNAVDDGVARAVGATEGRSAHVYGNGPDITPGWEPKGLRLRLGGTDVETPVDMALPLVGIAGNETHPLETIVGFGLLRPT